MDPEVRQPELESVLGHVQLKAQAKEPGHSSGLEPEAPHKPTEAITLQILQNV